MAYNNYYPTGYQPYYQPQVGTQMSQPNQPNTGIIWVQGEAGAKSYLVAPNSTVTLWDTESQTIYLKSADAVGMPSMKILDYTMRGMPETRQSEATGSFATKDDVEYLKGEIEALRSKFEDMRGAKK